MINNIITYLTFIPWTLVFVKNSLDKIGVKDKLTFKYLKENFFKIFRLDLLVLIVVFFYFATFDKGFVHKYLFAVMNLYLFINSFYENKVNKYKIKNKYITLIMIFILMFMPIVYYMLSNNLILTYKIMLICLYLENIIILIIKKFIKK